ncbi:Nucleoside 2-deoxyribosyltransferase [Alteracholeplasma palmae J233]|uniref:Nucleoside 2-deoxyribosyltransferase n=1 Tax=Alteracholeplasma palmae (strain ATCC 49389 / J233) TaxID=1318466 RepID=U4KKZ9_ALTPJ|nr:nucleoside 2-deoxyribosyltransferase [Alteracholeplasma palmae]CCV64514.1 Nucleoside 2-deoxyribosyltransferase [Alteracholeplasma palmae J233]
MKIYLANALFSEAEYLYNEILIDDITTSGHEVYAPQRNLSINDKTKSANSKEIYQGDKFHLDQSDAIVAVLDGITIDPGVSAEIGYMAALGKKIYGLYTDSRESSKTIIDSKKELLEKPLENQFAYVNLFVVGAIKENGKIFLSRTKLVDFLKQQK